MNSPKNKVFCIQNVDMSVLLLKNIMRSSFLLAEDNEEETLSNATDIMVSDDLDNIYSYKTADNETRVGIETRSEEEHCTLLEKGALLCVYVRA